MKILLYSSMREQGEGHHISTSHSVANTDAKRQELILTFNFELDSFLKLVSKIDEPH